MNMRVAITGMGIVSALGTGCDRTWRALQEARSGIHPIQSFDTKGLRMRFAAEVESEFEATMSPLQTRTVDRASLMAVTAASEALTQAGLWPQSDRLVGVALGVSGAGQYQNMPIPISRRHSVNRRMGLYQARNVPHFQATYLARHFGLHGPQATFSAASVAGALALGYAFDLLHAGKAAAMLAGGAEIQTLLNALGMDLLGISAEGRCSPFCASPGMTFGDGAAFVVLETLPDAIARGAQVLGELVSYGAAADAYDGLANDPAGRGLACAVNAALTQANMEPRDIKWVRASGTGHREQDAAEVLALRAVFGDLMPTVTSTEPYFGHVNGVSPTLGLIAGLLATTHGVVPALLDFDARPACQLPLAGDPRPTTGDFLLNAVAFGGTNAALIAGRVRSRTPRPSLNDIDIMISGLGVVAPTGIDLEHFLASLRDGRSAIAPVERFETGRAQAGLAGLVRDLDRMRVGAHLPLRGRERLVQYALVSAEQALADAGLNIRVGKHTRLGILVALTRGAMGAYERFFDQVLAGTFTATTGRLMLKMGRFSVASELAHVFGIRGYAGTISSGLGAGLHGLAVGTEILRRNSSLDALLVVAADELTSLSYRLFDSLGALAPSEKDFSPYNPCSGGSVLGEGAAAVLLERRHAMQARGGRARCQVAGYGLSSDAEPVVNLDNQGTWYARAIDSALAEARVQPSAIDVCIGLGTGWPDFDARELMALRAAGISADVPHNCLTAHSGLAESASGLFGAVAGALSLENGEIFPAASAVHPFGQVGKASGSPRSTDYKHALLVGSSERGSNTAVVLTQANAA